MVVENIQQERKQSTLPFIFFVTEKKKVFARRFQRKSQIIKTQKFHVQNVMMLDDTTRTCNITQVDCETCKIWVHKSCATQGEWLNVKRKSWLCVAHMKLIF